MGTVNKLLQRFITTLRWVASRPGDDEFAAFVCWQKKALLAGASRLDS